MHFPKMRLPVPSSECRFSPRALHRNTVYNISGRYTHKVIIFKKLIEAFSLDSISLITHMQW